MRRLVLLVALAACSRSSAPAPPPVPTAPAGSASAPTPTLAPAPTPACTSSLESRSADARSQYGASVHLATVDGTFLFIDPESSPTPAATSAYTIACTATSPPTSPAGIDGTSVMLHRAMARATCQWLDGQGQLWPLYQGWRDSLATDPHGVATFTRVTGRAPTTPEADATWRAWVLRTR